jgi:hypothetical protein
MIDIVAMDPGRPAKKKKTNPLDAVESELGDVRQDIG